MIQGFKDNYRFLSNFWIAHIVVPKNLFYFPYDYNVYVKSNEHAYQALKCSTLYDFKRVLLANTPAEAKRMGRIIEIRSDWSDVRLDIMYQINLLKYTNHDDLRDKLLATGDEYIEETNHWNDQFWGVCNGVGENNLGKILMRIRSELK